MRRGRTLDFVGVAVLGLFIFSGTSSAGLITKLTATDDAAVQSGVPEGSIFATVKVKAQSSNSVEITVNAKESVLDPGANFGIQKFGFDFDAAVTGTITITDLPAGWAVVEDKGLNGSGKFEIVGVGTAATRVDPLTFTITTSKTFADKSSIEHAFFEENKLGYHFAAQIAGFKSLGGSTSAIFTDGIPVPELATLLLFSAGIAGVVALRKSRKVRIA